MMVTARNWTSDGVVARAQVGEFTLIATRLVDGSYGFVVRRGREVLREGQGYYHMEGAIRQAESECDRLVEAYATRDQFASL